MAFAGGADKGIEPASHPPVFKADGDHETVPDLSEDDRATGAPHRGPATSEFLKNDFSLHDSEVG